MSRFIEELDFIKDNCEFIAFGVTPLHVIGIEAAYNQLIENTRQGMVGYIILVNHYITGVGINTSLFHNEYGNRVSFLNSTMEVRDSRFKKRVYGLFASLFLTHKKKVYLIGPEMRYEFISLLKNYDVCFVLIDDGCGSYTNDLQNRVITALDNYNGRKYSLAYYKLIIKVFFQIFYNKLLLGCMKLRNNYIDFRIFNYHHKRFERNSEACSFYVKQFQKASSQLDKRTWEVFENAVLINTQCLAENGIIDNILPAIANHAYLSVKIPPACVSRPCLAPAKLRSTSLSDEILPRNLLRTLQ